MGSIIYGGIKAGLISSSIGIGGGMVIKPIFNSLGMEGSETNGTSNLLMVSTGLAATIVFSCSGQINWEITLYLAIPCAIFSFLGSHFLIRTVNETGKLSTLIDIMFYILLVAIILLICKFMIILFSVPFWDNLSLFNSL